MHRYNNVRLEGSLTIDTTDQTALGNITQVPKVEFSINTDLAEIGGCHPISAFGRLALEVIAFSLVWNASNPGEPLHVSVSGRLHSITGTIYVVAERVIFYVHPNIRKAAVEQLNQLLENYNGNAARVVY